MLAEMGLPVFYPKTVKAPQSVNAHREPEALQVAALAAVDVRQPQEAPVAVRTAPATAPTPLDRRKTFASTGDPHPDWLVIGDADDDDADLKREPFAGDAGVLLDNMLKALGVSRGKRVHLAHVTKHAQGDPELRQRVEQLQPKVILAMGRFAVQALLATEEPIGRLRGRNHEFAGVPLFVTYAPAYLLRNLPDKARAWADLCLAQDTLSQRGG